MRTKRNQQEPPRRGRPPVAGVGTRRLNVTLDSDTIERARRAGGGNLSEGLRIAVSRLPS